MVSDSKAWQIGKEFWKSFILFKKGPNSVLPGQSDSISQFNIKTCFISSSTELKSQVIDKLNMTYVPCERACNFQVSGFLLYSAVLYLVMLLICVLTKQQNRYNCRGQNNGLIPTLKNCFRPGMRKTKFSRSLKFSPTLSKLQWRKNTSFRMKLARYFYFDCSSLFLSNFKFKKCHIEASNVMKTCN